AGRLGGAEVAAPADGELEGRALRAAQRRGRADAAARPVPRARAVPHPVRGDVGADRERRRAEVRRGQTMSKKKTEPAAKAVPAGVEQAPPPEQIWAEELAFLAAFDPGARPPSWRLTPKAVVTFIVGS